MLLLMLTLAKSEGELDSKATQSDYPKVVFFGDAHLHSRNSADACSLGNMNLTPADVYRF